MHIKRDIVRAVALWGKADHRLAVEDLANFRWFCTSHGGDGVFELPPSYHRSNVRLYVRYDDHLDVFAFAFIGAADWRAVDFNGVRCTIVVIPILFCCIKSGAWYIWFALHTS